MPIVDRDYRMLLFYSRITSLSLSRIVNKVSLKQYVTIHK